MKEKNKNKKLFIEFLREHDAIIPFIVNFYVFGPLNPRYKTLSAYLRENCTATYINGAFSWADDDFTFWCNINDKWIDRHKIL